MFTGESALVRRGRRRSPRRSAPRSRTSSGSVMPEQLDLHAHASPKQQQSTTIDRVWLDTTQPALWRDAHVAGAAARLPRRHAKSSRCPSRCPTQADGPLTLLVSDAPTLTTLEQRDLRPGKPASLDRAARADERRAPQQPALRSPHQRRHGHGRRRRDAAGAAGRRCGPFWTPTRPSRRASIARTVVGAWEQRLDRVVRGSRELTLTLSSDTVTALLVAHVPTLLVLLLSLRPSADRRARCIAASGPDVLDRRHRRRTSCKGTSDGVFVSLDGVRHRRPAAHQPADVDAGADLEPRGRRRTARCGPAPAAMAACCASGRVRPKRRCSTRRETNIFAVATSGTRVYAASSPDGSVYVIEGDGAGARRSSIPKRSTSGRWPSIAPGRLWVGAGNPAVVYRVDAGRNGPGRLSARRRRTSSSLALDAQGRMLAGTESPGPSVPIRRGRPAVRRCSIPAWPSCARSPSVAGGVVYRRRDRERRRRVVERRRIGLRSPSPRRPPPAPGAVSTVIVRRTASRSIALSHRRRRHVGDVLGIARRRSTTSRRTATAACSSRPARRAASIASTATGGALLTGVDAKQITRFASARPAAATCRSRSRPRIPAA